MFCVCVRRIIDLDMTSLSNSSSVVFSSTRGGRTYAPVASALLPSQIRVVSEDVRTVPGCRIHVVSGATGSGRTLFVSRDYDVDDWIDGSTTAVSDEYLWEFDLSRKACAVITDFNWRSVPIRFFQQFIYGASLDARCRTILVLISDDDFHDWYPTDDLGFNMLKCFVTRNVVLGLPHSDECPFAVRDSFGDNGNSKEESLRLCTCPSEFKGVFKTARSIMPDRKLESVIRNVSTVAVSSSHTPLTQPTTPMQSDDESESLASTVMYAMSSDSSVTEMDHSDRLPLKSLADAITQKDKI